MNLKKCTFVLISIGIATMITTTTTVPVLTPPTTTTTTTTPPTTPPTTTTTTSQPLTYGDGKVHAGNLFNLYQGY